MNLEVSVRQNRVVFGDGALAVTFQRTLRIPDDGRSYPLPPSLGSFPVRRVDDYEARVPREWLEHGGVFLPMYQREAMWMSFGSGTPHAVKVGIGKVCAITGERWSEGLDDDPQDYLVAPPQPWLDGICIGKGKIRQFVAMPLGMGYTVEGQVTGEETFGGIQIKVFAPKPGRFPAPRRYSPTDGMAFGAPPPASCAAMPCAPGAAPQQGGSMGLGAGGTMEQKVYPDPHGIHSWDRKSTGRVFVHIVNSALWREITGERAPETPITAKEYARYGFPWFELYDENLSTLKGTRKLKDVKSVRDLDAEESSHPLQDDTSVEPSFVKKLVMRARGIVRDGNW